LGIVGGEVSDFGKSARRVTERGGREKRVHGKGGKRGMRMKEIMGIQMGVLGASVCEEWKGSKWESRKKGGGD
jgi:hypothetical protein